MAPQRYHGRRHHGTHKETMLNTVVGAVRCAILRLGSARFCASMADPIDRFPSSFSWCEKGVNTVVRDQPGPTCQTMAVLTCMELSSQVHMNKVVRLSEDFMLDLGDRLGMPCNEPVVTEKGHVLTHRFPNDLSCAMAIKVLKEGIPLEDKSGDELKVDEFGKKIKGVKLSSLWAYVGDSPEDRFSLSTLLSAIMLQPVIICIDVGDDFDDYKYGLYFEHKWGELIRHSVVVGWIKDEQKRVFLKVLNSYGRHWGLNGHAFIDYKSCIVNGPLDLVIPIVGDNVKPVQWFSRPELHGFRDYGYLLKQGCCRR